MPKIGQGTNGRYAMMRGLDAEYLRLIAKSNACAPRSGEVPVGGGEWMDCFFHSEVIRGALSVLRKRGTIEEAVTEGAKAGREAIEIWNRKKKKDYQVHRWSGWEEDYIRGLILRFTPSLEFNGEDG